MLPKVTQLESRGAGRKPSVAYSHDRTLAMQVTSTPQRVLFALPPPSGVPQHQSSHAELA